VGVVVVPVVLAVIARCVMGDGALVARAVRIVRRAGHRRLIVAEPTHRDAT